jgi:hypothetical protein
MEVMRRFAAIAVADLRERTRATRFWVILGIVAFASWWCFPAPGSDWMTVSVDGQRGEYSSAWVGMTLALVYSTIMAWLGFYLVRGSLVRDFDTRVWQLLVATPMTRAGYLLAKWTSHMVVFALVVAIGLAIGVAAQLVRGEDRSIDLIELVKPVLVLTMPALGLTAFFAIVFDMVPWLRRAAGNVIYFFVWVFMFSTFAMNMDPETSEWARTTWFSDPSGVTMVQQQFIATLPTLAPGIDPYSVSIGVNVTEGSRETTFRWADWSFGAASLGGRLLWVLLAMTATAVLAPLLDAAARHTSATAPTRPGLRLRWLDWLLKPIVGSATGLVVASELKLVLRARRLWWWAALLAGAIVQLFAAPKGMAVAVIVAWVLCLDLFSRSLLRERDTDTAELVMTGPGAARRLRFARLATALALAIVPVLPALLRLGMATPADAGVLLLVAANVALAGLGLAALCRSPRPYELAMVFCAYIGVQDGGPLAFASIDASMLWMHALAAPLCLAAVVLAWPPRRDGDSGFIGRRVDRLRLAATTALATR